MTCGYNRVLKPLLVVLYWISTLSTDVFTAKASVSIDKWHQHGVCLSGFQDLLASSTHCFSINLSDLETWHDAENICKNISQYHGGHLATISSFELNSAISNYILNLNPENITTEIWIGLRNVDFEKGSPSIWKWSDGNHVNFTNWVPGFPVQIRNDCAQLEWSRFNSSKWFNSPCSSKRHFICQAPKVLPGATIIPECGIIGAPPITPATFEEYVIPFWFRDAVFRQDASLGFLSDQTRSTQNTVVCVWDYFLCIKQYGVWPSNKLCCSKRLKVCRKQMKVTKDRLDLGPDYTLSPLTVGDRWLTWPEHGTPPTVDDSTLQISLTTPPPSEIPLLMRIPTLNESCYTTGGGTTGAACVFPFIFRDKLRQSCTYEDADSEKPWCSVRVDKQGHHIGDKGLWGYCSSSCSTESNTFHLSTSAPPPTSEKMFFTSEKQETTENSQPISKYDFSSVNSINAIPDEKIKGQSSYKPMLSASSKIIALKRSTTPRGSVSSSNFHTKEAVLLGNNTKKDESYKFNVTNGTSSFTSKTAFTIIQLIPTTTMDILNEIRTVDLEKITTSGASTSVRDATKTAGTSSTSTKNLTFAKGTTKTITRGTKPSKIPTAKRTTTITKSTTEKTTKATTRRTTKLSIATKTMPTRSKIVKMSQAITRTTATTTITRRRDTTSAKTTPITTGAATKLAMIKTMTTSSSTTTTTTSTTTTITSTTTKSSTTTEAPSTFEILRRNFLSFFPNIFDINLNFLSWG